MSTPPTAADLPAIYAAWLARQDQSRARQTEIADLRGRLDVAEKNLALRPTRDDLAKQRKKAAKKAAKKLRAAHKAAALAGHALEDHALRKSARRLRNLLAAGEPKTPAIDAAFASYQRHGGRYGRRTWSRQVLQP